MKIILYINSLGKGGAERVMSVLANNLVKKHEVIMVNSYKLSDEYRLDSKVERYILDEDNVKNNSFIKRNFYRIIRLRKLIKVFKPDISVSFMPESNFRNIIACLFTNCKSVVSVRNDPLKEYPSRFLLTFAQIMYRHADGIVFQTEEAKNFFGSKISSKSIVIYNPIKQNFYSNKENVKRDIVMVGRLSKQKNYLVAFEAMKIIKSKTDFNLDIYGDGEEKEDLQKVVQEMKLSDRIFFKGVSSNLDKILDSYYLFIMTSDYEGMPNSLMEAMAKGMPTLCTDCPCGGPKELLPQNELFPVGDSLTLANKIYNFINNKALSIKYANLNKQKALEFKEDIIINEWEKYFCKIIGEKNG